MLLDRLVTSGAGATYEERKKHYFDLIRGLGPGVTEVILHLSSDDPEIRHVTGNWAPRWHEYRLFTDPETRALLEKEGIKPVGFRELFALWAREQKRTNRQPC